MSRRPTDSDDDLDIQLDETELDNFDLDDDDLSLEDGELEDDLNTRLNVAEVAYGPGVLVFGGRRYAVGLHWLTTPDEAEQSLVYKRAKAMNADFFCNRTFVSQSGFGFLSKGHRMGMPAAAAVAADTLVGEWHGMFSAENGWFYVAVHADTIAPEGDRFFESEEEAYNFYLEQANGYNWPKSYAPEAWNIKDSDGEVSLDKILDDVSTTSLKPANLDGVFSGKRNKSIAFMGLVFFIILVLLSFFAQTLLPGLIPDQRSLTGPAIEVADILSAPPQEPEKKVDPITLAIENFSLPKPSAVVDICMEGFADLTVSLPGWDLTTMRCRNTMVEAIWQQDSGTLETIKNYVDQFPFGVNRTYGAQGDFLASRVIGNLNKYNEKVNLAEREQVLFALNNRFGKIGRLQVEDIVPLSEQIQRGSNIRGARRLAAQSRQDQEDDEMTIQDLPSLSVKFITETAPVLLQDYFNVPGLRFNYIEWSVFNRQWTYDMQIYLQPQDAPSRRRLEQ
jgi:hypothetical protein